MIDHIVVLPGGAYQGHAPYEAEPVAEWIGSLGIGSSVFRYPVSTRHPGPLDAVRAEVRRLRSDGVDRVGVIGFSAGGHLAGHVALAPTTDAAERVDLAVLCYPVVSMVDGHEGSRRALLGDDASAETRRATSLDLLVTPEAPPFFVWHTAEDTGVPPTESYRLGTALARARVPHELHVFERGEHGVGFAEDVPGTEAWRGLAAGWLARHGWGSAAVPSAE